MIGAQLSCFEILPRYGCKASRIISSRRNGRALLWKRPDECRQRRVIAAWGAVSFLKGEVSLHHAASGLFATLVASIKAVAATPFRVGPGYYFLPNVAEAATLGGRSQPLRG